MSSIGSSGASGRIVAVLGPTNTGKTHYAVERMLGHRTGVIGLPLRLLARELYDRVAASVGRSRVALVTGEEKIVPANADYFLCTVEAMPMDRRFAFLAVDEIQLAADGERGHVFTDRLLRARGLEETMFLGAETMRPIVRRLVPDSRFVSRPRFSTLGFAGRKKLSRLPKRSAVVSFSAPDVYAMAELIRQHRGGAAVVLGALSPRTRNAQVAMFEAGDVDYLVATDAIGMGLNLNVDHVAFAGLSKYDGLARRDLTPVEIGQIAGRAGRHMRDGTFGTTADAGSLEPGTVERVENHRFDRVETVQWRNAALDFSSARGLIASLESAPPAAHRDVLARTRDAEDSMALKSLAAEPGTAALVKGRAAVKTLWEVCRIPDFRKTMAEAHARLLGRIYRHLMSPAGVLPTDWLADHVARLDRTDGDIDTLAARIAHIRTWTYISHRGEWLSDSRHWQERARAVEDELSDALHERLTQRFVDRRAAALLRRMNEKRPIHGYVDDDGAVVMEGHAVGRVEGFRFVPDRAALPARNRGPRAAVSRVVSRELRSRVERLVSDDDAAIALTPGRTLDWRGSPLARLTPGKDALHPGVALFPSGLDGEWTRRARKRLECWLADHIDRELRPLARLTDLTEAEAGEVGAAGRGLLFRLQEAMGLLPRAAVGNQLGRLGKAERAAVRRRGVRFGANSVFLPAMLRPERSALAVRLWQLHRIPNASPLVTPAAATVGAGPQGRASRLLWRGGIRPPRPPGHPRRRRRTPDGRGPRTGPGIPRPRERGAHGAGRMLGGRIRAGHAGSGIPPEAEPAGSFRKGPRARDEGRGRSRTGGEEACGPGLSVRRAGRTGGGGRTREDMSESLRLDRWLWFARFFKSRSLAARVCADRRIRVNGAVVAKPDHRVRIGDVLTFPQGREIRVVRVAGIGSRRGPAVEARTLFDDLSERADPGCAGRPSRTWDASA